MSSKFDTLINFSTKRHIEKLKEYIAGLEGDHWVSIKKYRKSRSKEANGYYWSVVVRLICDFQGYDPEIKEHRDKIHEDIKKQFNSKEIVYVRKVFKCRLEEDIFEYPKISDYIDKRGENIEALDGCILIPVSITRDIEGIEQFGEEIQIKDTKTISNSTASLNTAEFWEFINRVRDYYIEKHNLYIPEPQKDNKYTEVDDFDKMYSDIYG